MRAAASMSASQAAAEFQERSAHSNGPGSSCGHRRLGPSSAATAGHLPVDHSAISTQAAGPEVVDLCDSDDEVADAPLQPAGMPAQLPSGLQQHGTVQSSRQQQRHSQRQVQRQQQQRDGAAGGGGQGWQLGFAPSRPHASGAGRSSAADTSMAAGSGSGSNPFLSPARYIPEAGRL